jgi:hypothetical protein
MYGSGAHLFSHGEGHGHLHEPPASSRDGEKRG